MQTAKATQIEGELLSLPLQDQLWILERLAHSIRAKTTPPADLPQTLKEMAADPQIQRAMKAIE